MTEEEEEEEGQGTRRAGRQQMRSRRKARGARRGRERRGNSGTAASAADHPADCSLQTACAVLMFRCLPDAVLRPEGPPPLSSVSTSRRCILSYWFPFWPHLCENDGVNHPLRPLTLARVRCTPTPSTLLSPIFDHHIETL